MSKINLTIEADNAEDLQSALADMLAALGGDTASDDDTPVERPKTRRGRGKKTDPEPQTIEAKPEPQPEPKSEAKPEPEAVKPPKKEDVMVAMQALVDTGPAGVEATIKLLTDLGADDGNGQPRLSLLAEDKYATMIEQANAAAEKIAAGGGKEGGVFK